MITRSGEKRTTAVNINKGIRCEVYVGRGTPFGNPFVIGDKDEDGNKLDREEAIRKYREYFYQKLQMDPNFKKQVLALKGKILGCHCVPLLCHSSVLIEYLDGPQPSSTPS
jgi:hypothetical protein